MIKTGSIEGFLISLPHVVPGSLAIVFIFADFYYFIITALMHFYLAVSGLVRKHVSIVLDVLLVEELVVSLGLV